ncbi:uncharacterized protein DFL_009904 [Arthrobotrys flagrans]|uniref:Uncharacterized protein n=1 Tax=Arthrobotrys flagrans TaxID=97331 RepID=A0A436ZSZ5_ARTFL|nr:hypothetical protein DFL_009904 [Arthrobotrys flagrans]
MRGTTTEYSKLVWSQSVKIGNGGVDINDAIGEYAEGTTDTEALELVDNKDVNDAIWMHIKIGHEHHREADEPQSSTWERVVLPKESTIKDWANAILEVTKLQLRRAGKASSRDFDIDFREAFIKTHPAEGRCVDIWIIVPEDIENRFAIIQNSLKDIQLKQSGS